MDRAVFDQLVAEVLQELPADIRRLMDNVQITVEDWPTASTLRSVGLRPEQLLFGLYQGVPQTQRTSHYGLVLPDKITIFQGAIERVCRNSGRHPKAGPQNRVARTGTSLWHLRPAAQRVGRVLRCPTSLSPRQRPHLEYPFPYPQTVRF